MFIRCCTVWHHTDPPLSYFLAVLFAKRDLLTSYVVTYRYVDNMWKGVLPNHFFIPSVGCNVSFHRITCGPTITKLASAVDQYSPPPRNNVSGTSLVCGVSTNAGLRHNIVAGGGSLARRPIYTQENEISLFFAFGMFLIALIWVHLGALSATFSEIIVLISWYCAVQYQHVVLSSSPFRLSFISFCCMVSLWGFPHRFGFLRLVLDFKA